MKDSNKDKRIANKLFVKEKEDLWVSFSSYYKYRFNFIGATDNISIRLSFGGDSGDIYRSEVDSRPFSLGHITDLDKLVEEYDQGAIYDKDNNELYSWFNY